MSTGNACAAIGLANTNKIPAIGAYVQDITQPVGPGADGPCIGPIGPGFWDRNVMGEEIGFTCPATGGAATGKTAQWVISTVGLAAGTTRVNITAGDAVANASGTYDVYGVPAAGVPANSYFWAFER